MKFFDNDMDELFYKAGQEYPLNTGKKDWEAISGKLSGNQSPDASVKTINRYFRYLPALLLLLVPVVVLLYDAIPVRVSSQGRSQQSQEHEASRNDVMGPVKTETVAEASEASGEKKLVEESKKNFNGEYDPNNINRSSTSLVETRFEKGNEAATKTQLQPEFKTIELTNSFRMNKDIRQDRLRSAPFKLSIAEENRFGPAENFQNILPAQLQNNSTAPLARKSSERNKSHQFFYYGVKAGPDLSAIKGQKIEKAGYSAGLMAGYQFSRNFSIEASLLWSSKKYYSDGKYFDKGNAYIPASVEIYYLDGECNMLEFPVAVRYLFSPGKNLFFATAGLNSYFMQMENYGYMADAGTGMYYGHKDYKRSGNHIFSNLQLSGGYQLKILRKTQLRLEPYLQLPIGKVGIGRMPITSAGVHVGLLREIR